MSTELLVKTVVSGNAAYEGDNPQDSYGATDDVAASSNLTTAFVDDGDDDLENELMNSLKRDLPSRASRRSGRGNTIRRSPLDAGYQPVTADGHDGSHISLEVLGGGGGGGDGGTGGGVEEGGGGIKRRKSSKKLDKTIRRMTVTINEKKKVKEEAVQQEAVKMREVPGRQGKKKSNTISVWKEYKASLSMRIRRVFQNMKQALSSFHIWQGHMKKVQGIFGTGVLSYFTFLRYLVYFNVIMSLLIICFLLIPQTIYKTSYLHNNVTFTGLELITGEGWFEQSELYYGTYTNTTLGETVRWVLTNQTTNTYVRTSVSDGAPYNMQFAYLCIGCGYILIALAILVVSIGRQYKETYIIGGESFTRFSSKVFCSWDYTISSKDTALLKQQSIFRDILETVGPKQYDENPPLSARVKLLFLRLGTWFLALAIIVAAVYLIVYVTETSIDDLVTDKREVVKSMFPAIVISAVNIVIPPILRMIALLERYKLSETAVNVTLFRTILLQLSSICVYVAFLYIEVKKKKDVIIKEDSCWETRVGQVFYKLVVIDFLATLIYTFINEFLRNIFSKCSSCCKNYKPGFDISKNVLSLIYGQGIVWLGTFFAPLLPLIGVAKLIIIFYVKRVSVTYNCKPSVKPFKASKMNVLFRCLLSIMLIFTCIVIGVVVLDTGFMKPSRNCGPFRGETTIYHVVTATIEGHIPDGLEKVIEIITSWVVIAALIMILVLLAHYFRLKKNTTAKKIEGLKYQLTLASQDKQFLIRQIRDMVKNAPKGAAGTLSGSSTVQQDFESAKER